MKKRSKKLLSLFLSAMMVFSVVPATVYAEPAAEETTAEQTAGQEEDTEAVQDDADAEEADATAEEADTTAEEADKDSSKTEAATDNGVATQAENNETKATTGTVTGSIDLSGIKFGGANAAVADNMVKNQDVKIDESDPTVAQLKKELENIEIVGGEAEDTDSRAAVATYAAEDESDTSKEKKPLTKEQIQKVLAMFQEYQKQWKKYADVLGVQMPFYLSYNDDNDDGLGVLGEMLVLAGKSVDDVRSGEYTYDDVTGMILNFQFGDKYGVEYYGDTVKSVRDKGLEAVKKSGAKTEVQKLLALNDYLAQIDTFDMAYIMNSSDKDSDTPTMQAPEPTKNIHWDTMYKAVYAVYEDSIKETFENKIKDGLFDNATKQALRQSDACKDMTDEEFSAFLETEDGKAMYNGYYDNVKNSITNDGMDVPMEDGTTVHMTLDQIVAAQMDTAMDDLGGMTPNQAIPEYAKQAATQLTDGIVNYWEGTQFGAMALGKSVCLGYSKAYAYMIQCMHSDIYTTDGNIDNASSWKTAKDLYYAEDGKTIDIKKDYVVDLVRITFDTSVTMYGTKNNGFNSDHFWNAVKVDGKWYYIDPCYTDVYTEVMSRNRGEINGSMNHMYFMFSDTSARKMYDGYFNSTSGLKSLYKDVATDKTYETAWPARIASTTSYDGNGNAYYSYSSQDLFSMITSDNPDYTKMMNTEYKIVQHKMGDTLKDDQDDGDSDYNTLIFINKEADDSSKNSKASSSLGSSSNKNYVAQVYNPETKELEDNDMLTKAVKQYMNDTAIYPSIFTSSYYYNGKVYFNISNAIYTYDMKTGKVALVKEYNEVVGHRDATEAFGAMAFTTGTPAKDAKMDITVNNAPIAGFTIKDGKMQVSIATNYAWVSGRTQHEVYSNQADKNGNYPMRDDVKKTYGYEFQESNYNQSYSNYKSSSYGNDETNDNDEFMWTACIEDDIDLSHFEGEHSDTDYEKVTVAPTCGKNGYTEERCKTCGKIKEGSRKEEKDTALDHHYVHYNETYYTKTNDKWNTGDSYVCVDCGYAVQSDDDDDNLNSDKSVIGAKDTYALAKEKAGHTYAPVKEDAVDWTSEKDGKVTLAKDTDVSCTDCSTKKLDCLQNYEEAGKTVTAKTDKDITLDVTTSHTGTCDEGVTTVYKASGKDDNNNKITATKSEKAKAGKHQYTGEFTWTEKKDEDGKGTGEYEVTVKDVKCSVCGYEPKADEISDVVVKKDDENSKAATCEEAGTDVYIATVTIKGADGKEDETLSDTKNVEVKATGHKYGEPTWKWSDDNKTATATFTCENNKEHVQNVEVETTSKTTAATCEKAGETVYTATANFAGKDYTDTKKVEIPALGHKYGEPTWKWSDDNKTATATFTCENDKAHVETVDATVKSETTAATCDAVGKTVYTATVHFGEKDYTATKEVEIKALGHKYGKPEWKWSDDKKTATATFTCENDKTHVETVDATVTEKSEGATCTEPGKIIYTATVEFDGEKYTDTAEVEGKALGHKYGKPEWKWSDDYKTATATFTCENDKTHVETVDATIKSETTAATCEVAGKTVYTATVHFGDNDYTDTKEVEIKALGHKYGKPEWKWSDDHKTATATFTCENDKTHVETVDATVTEKSEDATCTKAGKVTYTATVELNGEKYTDTAEVDGKPLGHDYKVAEKDGWKWSDDNSSATATIVCSRCDDKQTVEATVTKDVTEATCDKDGATKYTAVATYDNQEFKTEKTEPIKATGHKYDKPVFNWTENEDGTWTATEATRTCKVDGYVQKATKVEVTPKTEEATCTKGGKVTFIASATFEGEKEPLTESKDSTVMALGHNYEVTWDWAKDYSSAKATFTCTRGDVKETVDATVEKTEENGQIVYTATATYDGVTKKSTKNLTMSISYKTHIQDIGWEDSWKKDGSKSGTTGQAKQLEAIKIKLPENVSGSVEYYSHVQDKGWEKAWSHKDGEESGTTGSFKKLEAIKIRLSGKVADNYDIYYRVHAENFGWLGWAKNGESAGTAGYNYRLEAIQIVLVKKGETAVLPSDPKSNYEDAMISRLVKYQAHIRDLGDQSVVYDGDTAGTVGRAKPIEALKISLPSLPDGTIKYDAHVENIGWQNKWAKNGEMIGTKGRALQIEALKIDLDGSVKDEYDIYYRVHSANIGWLGWAKNGESAGTAGFAYGVEAVQIKLVKKGTTPNLPASPNEKAFIQK